MSLTINQMRESGRQARRDIDDGDRATFSSRICQRFLHTALFFRSKSIACYLATPDEVDTSTIIERAWNAKKRVFVPLIENRIHMRFVEITRNTRLERNQFGILEPSSGPVISPEKLDVVVTPLVVFDQSRNRIGSGGGYYDRCFSFQKQNRKWQHPKLVGVAFDCQEVEKISPNPWDIRLYRVFTETSQRL